MAVFQSPHDNTNLESVMMIGTGLVSYWVDILLRAVFVNSEEMMVFSVLFYLFLEVEL